MNQLIIKIMLAMASAGVGGVLTYGFKAVAIEGRLDGIERAVIRIENKMHAEK